MINPQPEATAPVLVHDRTVTELVFPVTVKAVHERGEGIVAKLAGHWNVPVRLVHVSDLIDRVDPDLEAYADRMRHRHPEVTFKTSHVFGHDIATGVSSIVQAHSLLVMTTEHADEWKVKGSVAEKVLFSSGVPVMLFGPHALDVDLDGEVIVGLDGSAAAESALEPAAGIAAAIGARIWVVRVVEEPHAGDSPRTDIAAYVTEKAEQLGGPGDAGWEVIFSNDPVDALEAFARSRDAAFIVAGARGRSSVLRRSMGSITMGLVSRAERPVLAVAVPETPMLDAD